MNAVVQDSIEVPLLVVDDSLTYLNSVVGWFLDLGLKFRRAMSPEDASVEFENSMPRMLCIDQEFVNSELSGEIWLKKNEKLVDSLELVALVTAYPADVEDIAWLNSHRVKIVEKGEKEEQDFWQELANCFSKEAKERSHAFPTEDIREHKAERVYYDQFKPIIRDWIQSQDDSEQQDLYYDGSAYSLEDIGKEIDTASPLGLRFLSFMVDQFRDFLGISKVKGDQN